VRFVLTDGLRPTNAQQKMLDSKIVKANPHWLDELLSKPGQGGHPRGMAVDIYLETLNGDVLDMGTALDHFSTDVNDNPAARNYKGFAPHVYQNRNLLENLMMDAAQQLNTPLLPLPSEWWDFRLPPEFFNDYTPLHDDDLPAHMKMCL
jgi:D-alanyl-D-alanine dipeptidase